MGQGVDVGVAREIIVWKCEKGWVTVTGVYVGLFQALAERKDIVVAQTAATARRNVMRDKD